MEIRDVPLDELILDPALNLRDRLDQDTVDRYMDSFDRLPPVTVFLVDGRWLLADGIHRHAAAVTLGRRTLPAEVRAGSFEEALDFVAGANLFHGLPLSRSERRRAIEVKLRLHHERSDRHLSEEMGVGRELVAEIRRSLIEGGQIPNSTTRLGADGKSYPALPKDPNERRPRTNEAGGLEPERAQGRAAVAPWDDSSDPLPPLSQGNPKGHTPPWESDLPDARAVAREPLVASAPTIDEMLSLMTRQVKEVVDWTYEEGFLEGYRSASANARGLFQAAAIKLAARAGELRKV
jgi:hypothetical protein